MLKRRIPTASFAATCVLSVAAATTVAAESPALTTLRVEVVSKADGTPQAGIQVVMADAEHGELALGPFGRMSCDGPTTRSDTAYIRRNARTFADGFTDPNGVLILRGFSPETTRWHIAAGDYKHGLTLLRNVELSKYAEKPLRIELEARSDIVLQRPLPESEESTWPAIELLNTQPEVSISPATATQPAESTAPSPAIVLTARIDLNISWQWRTKGPDANQPWHIGPLPPGYRYRLGYRTRDQEWADRSLLAEQIIDLRAGETVAVTLANPVTTQPAANEEAAPNKSREPA